MTQDNKTTQNKLSSNRWSDRWTAIFSIDEFVADHILKMGREWTLCLMKEFLLVPKNAHSRWVLQFSEAMAVLGIEKCKKLKKGLYRKEVQRQAQDKYFEDIPVVSKINIPPHIIATIKDNKSVEI